MEYRVKVASNGRLVLPKKARDAIGLGPEGGTLVIRVEDGVASMETPLNAMMRLKSLLAPLASRLKSEGRLASDELIADRRLEFWKEEREFYDALDTREKNNAA